MTTYSIDLRTKKNQNIPEKMYSFFFIYLCSPTLDFSYLSLLPSLLSFFSLLFLFLFFPVFSDLQFCFLFSEKITYYLKTGWTSKITHMTDHTVFYNKACQSDLLYMASLWLGLLRTGFQEEL